MKKVTQFFYYVFIGQVKVTDFFNDAIKFVQTFIVANSNIMIIYLN